MQRITQHNSVDTFGGLKIISKWRCFVAPIAAGGLAKYHNHMAEVSRQKWNELNERMRVLGIHEADLAETFSLGGGPGGQKVNKTHNVVQLSYNNFRIRSKKSRSREDNRFFARRELCNQVAEALGIPSKDDAKIKRAIKQKKRRKKKSSKKYA